MNKLLLSNQNFIIILIIENNISGYLAGRPLVNLIFLICLWWCSYGFKLFIKYLTII